MARLSFLGVWESTIVSRLETLANLEVGAASHRPGSRAVIPTFVEKYFPGKVGLPAPLLRFRA
jgi:hypothetical protein